MQFTPLEDFFSDELRSQYCVGLSYTVREKDLVLQSLLPEWLEKGLVILGPPENAVAQQVAGQGKVGE
jgi:hypothetical protein